MVNFRFHLVSLTAVFLALALGLVIGSTVVDRVTVEQIQSRLEDVRTRADETNARNEQLEQELARWREFGEQADDRLVQGRLQGVPVLIFTVVGGPGEPIEQLERSVTAAGAVLAGRLTFTEKWRLQSEDDVRQLAAIIGSSSTRPEVVQRSAITRLGAELFSAAGQTLLAALRQSAFLQYDGPRPDEALPFPGTRVVVASDADVAIPNPQLLHPLVQELGRNGAPVLAVEPLVVEGAARRRGVFLAPLRTGQVATRISTVDNIEISRGQIAAVLALQYLAADRTGHYGEGAGATLLPETPTP